MLRIPSARPRRARQGDPRVAVGYVRCSTKDRQQASPDVQRTNIEAWARANGITIAAWHEERVSGTAAIEDRPELVAAIAALRERRAGVLVVAKRDRLARDSDAAGLISYEVRRQGAEVVSVDGAAFADGPAGKLVRTVLDAAAEFEGGMLRARIKDALAKKRAKGRVVGQVPFGWARQGADLVPVEHEQAAVRYAAELRGHGLGYLKIARELERRGHKPRGRAWYPMTVRNILAFEATLPDALRARLAPRKPARRPAGRSGAER